MLTSSPGLSCWRYGRDFSDIGSSSGQNRFNMNFASQESGLSHVTAVLPFTNSNKRRASWSPAAATQTKQQKCAVTARHVVVVGVKKL